MCGPYNKCSNTFGPTFTLSLTCLFYITGIYKQVTWYKKKVVSVFGRINLPYKMNLTLTIRFKTKLRKFLRRNLIKLNNLVLSFIEFVTFETRHKTITQEILNLTKMARTNRIWIYTVIGISNWFLTQNNYFNLSINFKDP